jgi:lipopolysaccharide/colanic/teichoic acid biosynthesis glycosyltransferase
LVQTGITDLASVQYRDEAELLGRFENPEAAYIGHILPNKIKLAKDYVKRSSLFFDITLILKTFLKLFH